MKLTRFSLLAALAIPASGLPAQSADFPNKPVRIVIPSGPGSPVDTVARLTSAFMESRFKQPVIVDNRPGAANQIAVDIVAKAANDGYTLLVSPHGFIIEQAVNPDWPFRFEKDLTPVSIITGTGFVVAVSNKTPAVNLRELVAYSKANSGKLNEAMPGAFSADIAMMRHALGMGPVEYIFYKGAAPTTTALITGDVDFSGLVVLSVLSFQQAGKLRIFAYTGKQRHPLIPNVPTVNEAGVGVQDFEAGYWVALMGPPGMPSDFVNKLHAAILGMVKTPEIASKLSAVSLVPEGLDPAQSRARMVALLKKYQEAVAAGVRMR